MEGDATDGVPGGVFVAQPVLDATGVGGEEGGDAPGERLPPTLGGVGREVLGAGEGGRGGEEGGAFFGCGRGDGGGVARLAEAGEEAARPLAQPAPGGVELGIEKAGGEEKKQGGLAPGGGGGELPAGAVLGRAFAVEDAFGG